MKTILFLLDRYPGYGGIEIVTTCLANELVEQYHIILCSLKQENEEELLPRLDSRIIYRPLPVTTSKYNSDNLHAFQQILHDEGVDLVVYQDSYAPNEYLPLSINKDSGIKLIVAEHSSPCYARRWLYIKLTSTPWWNIVRKAASLYYGAKGVYISLKRRTALYKHCDRYILLSQSLRQEFLQNSFVKDTGKLDTISNPVSYTPRPLALKEKKKQVLFVGQFAYDKGIGYLLRIWQKIARHAGEWELVLVGDGAMMNETKRFIAQNNLPRVSIEGYRNNVQDYCRDASILCMCSSFEGFPMVLPEAMCSGAVPIAFSSFTAIDDIFTDGISGYKIPCFDEGIYADRLLHLIKDKELRLNMARAALQQAEAFKLSSIINKWTEIIEQL